MSTSTEDKILELYNSGIILPKSAKLNQEFSYYKTHGKFKNKLLENRRQICPTLFIPGHNVLGDIDYFYLNVEKQDVLDDYHPRVSFFSYENIINFCCTSTFYLVENKEDLMGEDILCNEYQNCDLLFLFICPGDVTGPCQIYSQEELIGSFLYCYDFFDPHSKTNERFTLVQIYRLLRILYEIHRNNSAAATFIDVIETVLSGTIRQMKIIQEIHLYVKENVEFSHKFFDKLLDIAMFMRGWTKGESHPLASIDTSNSVNETILMEKLFKFNQDCSSKYKILSSLPLFIYRSEFILSNNADVGYTIAEKIESILRNASTNACIRMSSNWLASTAWYYLNEFFDEKPFDIDRLSEII